MIRNLKKLGLALVAVFAVSAVVASAASAASFTSSAPTTIISADQATTHVFEITGLRVTCSTATFQGHTTGNSLTSVTLTPTYTGCKAQKSPLSVEAKITGFGHYGEEETCDYVIHANGMADLACPFGTEVTIDAGPCTIHVPPQTNLGTITFANGTIAGKSDITATLNLTEILVTHTDESTCPFEGNGTARIGILAGTSTVTGTNPLGEPVNISHHPDPEPDPDPGPAITFTSSAATTNYQASGTNHVFSVAEMDITCTTADLKGEATGTSIASITLTPTYTGCTAKYGAFSAAATVTGFGHNGDGGTCDYVVYVTGKADLVCSSGEVTIDVGTCVIHVPAQTNLGTVSFANGTSSGKGDITATLNLKEVNTSYTDGTACPFEGNGSGKIGTLTGTSTVTGTDAGGNPASISRDTAFTSSASTTNFSADGANHVFAVTGLATNCATADFRGHAKAATVSSVTLTPLYTGCTAKLGIFSVSATVTGFARHYGEAGQCDYVIHGAGTADLVCPPGAEVTVDAGTCTVHVPAQKGLGTISYVNGTSGGKSDITATLNLKEIQVSHTDGFGCPFSGSGSGKIGTLVGTSTVTGTNVLGEQVSISHDA